MKPASLAIVLLLLAAAPADACTAMLKPVNQVVREADVILRARAIAVPPWMRTGGGVLFRVLEVVAGTYHPLFFSTTGILADHPRPAGRAVPYEQIDCVGRVPGCGSCFAQRYREGTEYLLLLRDGTPYWAPLSPTTEEISGPDDPWLAWVRARR